MIARLTWTIILLGNNTVARERNMSDMDESSYEMGNNIIVRKSSRADIAENRYKMDNNSVVGKRNRAADMHNNSCEPDRTSSATDDDHTSGTVHCNMSDRADHKPGKDGNRMDRECNSSEDSNGTNKDCTYTDCNPTDNEHRCDICSKTFAKSRGLTGHRLRHTGECPYICVFCEKGFNVRSNLKAHLRIHTGQKPFECEICKKSFTQKGQLKQHQRIHSGELPYLCGTCDKAFRNGSALVTHLRTHTGEKPYRCDICSRSFTTSTSLKTHRVTHSGEMLFDCPLCKRQFNRRNNLNVHIKRHNKDRRFTCSLCHNGFVMKAHLLRHLKRSHKIDFKRECITHYDSSPPKTILHSVAGQILNSEQPYNYTNKGFMTEKTKSFSGSPRKRSDPNNNDGAVLMKAREIKQENSNDKSSNVLITGSDNGDKEMEIKDTFAENVFTSLNKSVVPDSIQVKQEVGDFRMEDFKPDGNEMKEENIEAFHDVNEDCPEIPPNGPVLDSDGFLATKEDSYKTIPTYIKQEPLDSETQ